jgi:hypothetical protein
MSPLRRPPLARSDEGRPESAADRAPLKPRRPPGRPPFPAEIVRARVAEYCERYGVTPSPHGLPPFPSGQRETAQHREWLAVYRSVRRLAARSGSTPDEDRRRTAADPSRACAVCNGPLGVGAAARELKLGPGRTVRLHEKCAELAERSRSAGFETLARLTRLLWPAR